MKVKNIVFSGFAAAILMGVAADASAATQVATKAYVDSLDNELLAPEGSVVSGVTQEDGKVMSLTWTEFNTVIPEENPSNITAPTTAAVYNFVTSAVDGMEYSGDDTYITVNNDDNEIGLTNITNEAAGITGTSTALTTGKAVYDYVAANDDDTTYTAGSHIAIDAANNIAVNDVTNAGTDIVSGDTGLTTGNAVYEYVTNAVDGMEYSGDDYITVDNDNNEIELTNITNEADGIIAGNTELTTANAVFEYVDELTGGVLPQGCDEPTDNCALVKLNGQLQWVDLTTPLQ